jgi:hypothetical protein
MCEGRFMADHVSSGDENPAGRSLIEVHVADVEQLFNHIDPSPFHDRDLDRNVEEFIVGWSTDFPADAPLALVVHVDEPTDLAREADAVRKAIKQYFATRARSTRRRLRVLLQRGRVSLMIGLGFLILSLGTSEILQTWLNPGGILSVLRESVLIGGWVAMWRPLEIFLYDWWPIRGEARLFDRLAAMPVSVNARAAAHRG